MNIESVISTRRKKEVIRRYFLDLLLSTSFFFFFCIIGKLFSNTLKDFLITLSNDFETISFSFEIFRRVAMQ